MIIVCFFFYQASLSVLLSPFTKKGKLRVLNFEWSLIRGEDIRKALIGTTKGWPRLLNSGDRLIAVAG